MPDTDAPSLVPQHQKVVQFYDDSITVALVEAEMYVPLRPIVEALGLSWGSQRNRVQRDEVLAQQVRQVTMAGADGRQRDLVCIPLDTLPGWLFGITTSRVRPELQPKLSRYRAECFRVLWNAFKQDILPTVQPTTMPVPTDRSGAAIAYEIATAVQHLARQQMELEQEQQQLAGRVQAMARWGKQTDDRLASLELSLSEGNFIPAAKATELSERVKALATLMTERGTKDNHDQGVFAELYRRFGVSSYKTLTNEQYAAVMAFLEQWREAVLSGSNDPPTASS
jgi:hypothetical protein